jgi:hypothetical protein
VEPRDYFEPKVFFVLEPDGAYRDLMEKLKEYDLIPITE